MLFGVAKAFGVIDDSTFIIGIGVISVSMAFTPSLYALGCRLTKKMVIADVENSALKPDDAAHSAKVVVAGYGDTGYVLAQNAAGFRHSAHCD
ncbi:Uncharacterised protein [Leminorella grimontii]|nr:Uncharacterised protein [Leminorella grimontii]